MVLLRQEKPTHQKYHTYQEHTMRLTKYILSVALILASTLYANSQDLVILHTNDTHSQIEPQVAGADKGTAGVVRREKYISSVRAENENVLLFDAGDFSQGSPYFTLFKGDVEIEVMNALGVDVACWGNHEFDNGKSELARRAKNANFPIVCANYDLGETELKDVIKPYTVVEKAGKRIGVIGLSVKLTGFVSPKNIEGLTYLHPYKVVNKYAKILRNEEKCDLVIVLSHCGYNSGKEQSPDDQMIARNTEGVDVIIGGHTHTFLDEPAIIENKAGKKVVVVQAGERGAEVGRLDLWF